MEFPLPKSAICTPVVSNKLLPELRGLFNYKCCYIPQDFHILYSPPLSIIPTYRVLLQIIVFFAFNEVTKSNSTLYSFIKGLNIPLLSYYSLHINILEEIQRRFLKYMVLRIVKKLPFICPTLYIITFNAKDLLWNQSVGADVLRTYYFCIK